MTVNCSQMSNMLKLVHLLLSKSLLIVLDEFEKIMYIHQAMRSIVDCTTADQPQSGPVREQHLIVGIMYIVSQMFFIIIQLLYAVACVAVSSLLKSGCL